MIDSTFLDRGFSENPEEPLYAEFYANGQLKMFRSGTSHEGGKAIALFLERGKRDGRVEQSEVTFYESDTEDGADFEYWVRHTVGRIYEQNQFVHRCGFCEKSNSEVALLIAGPTAYICDECIGTCSRILADNQAAKPAVPGQEQE
jgi:hypothetical protein